MSLLLFSSVQLKVDILIDDSLYTTVWLKTIQPLLPKTLQRFGPATVRGGH